MGIFSVSSSKSGKEKVNRNAKKKSNGILLHTCITGQSSHRHPWHKKNISLPLKMMVGMGFGHFSGAFAVKLWQGINTFWSGGCDVFFVIFITPKFKGDHPHLGCLLAGLMLGKSPSKNMDSPMVGAKWPLNLVESVPKSRKKTSPRM